MELRRYTWEQKLLCVLLLISPVLVVGQTGASQGTRGRTDPIQTELRRRFELEAIERVLAEGPRRRGVSDRDLLLTQIREDFLRIQIVNDEIQKSVTAYQLDLKLIAKSAAEIARCARRLKTNLALPESESNPTPQGATVELNVTELRLSLAILNSAINSFVANPVFEKSGVVDANLSAQASRDLAQIIDVSNQAKRSGEKLQGPKPA